MLDRVYLQVVQHYQVRSVDGFDDLECPRKGLYIWGHSPVIIYGWTFVKEIGSNLERIDNNEISAHDIESYDVWVCEGKHRSASFN